MVDSVLEAFAPRQQVSSVETANEVHVHPLRPPHSAYIFRLLAFPLHYQNFLGDLSQYPRIGTSRVSFIHLFVYAEAFDSLLPSGGRITRDDLPACLPCSRYSYFTC